MRKPKHYTDRNGTVIREGDVIRFNMIGGGRCYVAEAQWSGTGWEFGVFPIKEIDFAKCRIIFNVYDNWEEEDD